MRILLSVTLALSLLTLSPLPAAAGLMGPPPQIGDAFQCDVSYESGSPNDSFTESTNVTVRNWLKDAQIQATSDSRSAMLFFNDVRAIADSAPDAPKVDDVWATAVAVPVAGDRTIRLRVSIKVDNVADERTDVELIVSAVELQTEVFGAGVARVGQWTRSWSLTKE